MESTSWKCQIGNLVCCERGYLWSLLGTCLMRMSRNRSNFEIFKSSITRLNCKVFKITFNYTEHRECFVSFIIYVVSK